jgi:hypothetical protein
MIEVAIILFFNNFFSKFAYLISPNLGIFNFKYLSYFEEKIQFIHLKCLFKCIPPERLMQ